MIFEPEPGTSLDLNGESIDFVPLEATGPAAVFVYAESGKEGTVYKVLKGREFYALKVFYPEYRNKRLLETTEKLSRFKNLEGFRVAERTIISQKLFPDVVARYPDLNYSVLMPWIDGTVWGNLLLMDDRPLQREHDFQIIQSLMKAVYNLESKGLAHCDLSNNNFIIDPTLSSIQLIDIEDMYAPDMPRPIPDISYGTPGYRTKWIAEKGLWSPEGDRFASAILCSEILTWHDKDVRKNKAGNTSYFDEDEIGENTERYQLVKECLSRLSNELAVLFEKAWFSEGFDQCPSVADWMNAIEEIGPSIFKAKEETPLPIDKNLSKRREKTGRKSGQARKNDIPPKMEISHSILDFGRLRQPENVLEFWISNIGGAVLTGNINSVSWMEVSPSHFSLLPGDNQIFTVSLNSELPKPRVGLEHRTLSALVIESNTGEEVIGATYKFAKPSFYKPEFGWLIIGLIAIILSAIYFQKTSDSSGFRLPIYYGLAGVFAGLTTKTIKDFHKYQDILKAVGINGLIILISFPILNLPTDKIIETIVWNSLLLIFLMVVFARTVKRDNVELEKRAAEVEENKVSRTAQVRYPQETTKKSMREAAIEQKTRQLSVGSVYVYADDGTALYSSLPASNNWIVWLEKGSELTIVGPLEEAMASMRRFGYYIEVVDKNGNKGFVTATAVKIKYT
jgi:serine/threonine protein kinase